MCGYPFYPCISKSHLENEERGKNMDGLILMHFNIFFSSFDVAHNLTTLVSFVWSYPPLFVILNPTANVMRIFSSQNIMRKIMQQDLGVENNVLVISMGLPFCDNLIFILQFNMIKKINKCISHDK